MKLDLRLHSLTLVLSHCSMLLYAVIRFSLDSAVHVLLEIVSTSDHRYLWQLEEIICKFQQLLTHRL